MNRRMRVLPETEGALVVELTMATGKGVDGGVMAHGQRQVVTVSNRETLALFPLSAFVFFFPFSSPFWLNAILSFPFAFAFPLPFLLFLFCPYSPVFPFVSLCSSSFFFLLLSLLLSLFFYLSFCLPSFFFFFFFTFLPCCSVIFPLYL